MTSPLTQALRQQKKSAQKKYIAGTLGIDLGGQRIVEVPNRNAFVYVKLRDNQNEIIQAFNNKVAPSYNLPVLVEREGNRYVVSSVNSTRYQNNWNSFAPFLPRHGNTHAFDPDNSGGGDVVWVHPRQMMPSLIAPSGTLGAPNVIMSSYVLGLVNGNWKYTGNTGTSNLTPYKPHSTGTTLVLVYLDSNTGNPGFIFSTGTYLSPTITGTSQLIPYFPTLANPSSQIPLSVVRLVSGTSSIGWDNIYDVRQWIHTTVTGSGGSSALNVQDEGVPLGTAATLNFVGDPVNASISGSVARIYITGSAGGTNLTGTSIGIPNRNVVTDSSGFLTSNSGIGWGLAGSYGYLDFGINVSNRESNAGKMGYELFTSGYLEVVGAGTGSGHRRVKIYDNLVVSSNMSAGSYTLPGVVSQLITTDSGGNFAGSENYNLSGTYGRKNFGWVSVTPEDGWIFTTEDWTRTGNLSFAIVGQGDLSAKYRKGTKVKYNDPALEFGVIGSVHVTGTNTFVNLISNTDYAMAAATITNRYISYTENPEAFPHWFTWNANPQGFSAVPATPSYMWTTKGTEIFIQYVEENAGTSNATTFTATAPIAPIVLVTNVLGTITDNGTVQTTSGRLQIAGGSTTITFRTDMNVGAWTNANGKRAVVYFFYRF